MSFPELSIAHEGWHPLLLCILGEPSPGCRERQGRWKAWTSNGGRGSQEPTEKSWDHSQEVCRSVGPERKDRKTNMQKHLSRAIWNHTGHFYLRLCSLSGILYKCVCTPLFSLSYKLTKGSFCFYLLYLRYVCMLSIGNCTESIHYVNGLVYPDITSVGWTLAVCRHQMTR